ncbi:MAG TPA: complex I NDUFA9 subunit family protein [Steroidobacteraceae bacterium]
MAANGLTICVLGGTGFVGSALVMRLARLGHWVRVPTRALQNGAHLRVLPTVELHLANIHDPRVLGQLFTGVDVIVNLVGILNEGWRSSSGFRKAHTELATKVIKAAQAARVRRLLHMSSLGADANTAPSLYLRTKGEAENAVRAASDFIDATIFKPSVIFGPNDSLTRRFARLLRMSHGFLPLARPNARFAPVYVYDVVEAFIRALNQRSTIGQTYELCGPDVMTFEELVRQIAAAADLPCHIIPLPDFMARMQALVMGLMPGKPFTLDNFRSLTVDSVCRENGLLKLGIKPTRMSSLLRSYLVSSPGTTG